MVLIISTEFLVFLTLTFSLLNHKNDDCNSYRVFNFDFEGKNQFFFHKNYPHL